MASSSSIFHFRSCSALAAGASPFLHLHLHLHLHPICRSAAAAAASGARAPARLTTTTTTTTTTIVRFKQRVIRRSRRRRRRKSMSRLSVIPQSQARQDIEEVQEHDLEKGQQPESFEPMAQFRKDKRRKMFLGVELSPDIMAISIVYFVQGVLGISRLAVSFFLKDNLHLDPAESAVISGFSAAPWLIKPVYGFISDGIPLFGYRRRSYLVLCGLLGAVAWIVMATLVEDKYSAVFAILLSSLSVAFSDVVVDSMAVERARGEAQSTSGSIQSLCWGSSAVGGIVSAYFSGSLIEAYGVRFVFSITSLLPLLTTVVAIFVTEKPLTSFSRNNLTTEQRTVTPKSTVALDNAKANLLILWKTIKDPAIFLPTIFIFLWQATPTSDTAMFFFSTNKLGFGPEFLGRVRLVTSIASLAGVGLYNGFLKNVPLRKMFFWTTLIGCGLSLTQLVLVIGFNQKLGISNEWFAMGDTLVLTVLGQVSFMPVLVLAARICPPGVEATLFATLMSISNGGSVCGGLIGAWVTQLLGITGQNFDNLASLLILCNATSLLPIPLLGLLPSEAEINTEEKKQQSFSSETKDN